MAFTIPNPYRGNYKLLMAAPILTVLVSLILIFFVSPIHQGIDFRGGIDVTMQSPQQADTATLRGALESAGYVVYLVESKPNPTGYVTQIEMERSDAVVKADTLKTNYYLQSAAVLNNETAAVYKNSSENLNAFQESRVKLNAIADSLFNLTGHPDLAASNFNATRSLDAAVVNATNDLAQRENDRLRTLLVTQVPDSAASFEEVTSTLSSKFLERAISVVIYSIIFTSIVVFLIFRTIVPSLAVLTGAAADVIIAMGAMSIFHIPLTLASFAALLMLVGFSLDTDVLLSMRVLKRHEGHAADRAYESMKTGMTMSLSAIVAFSALMVLALTTHIAIYYEIAAVALAGLVGDVVATWCFNAVIVLHYMEEQEKKGGAAPAKPLAAYLFKN